MIYQSDTMSPNTDCRKLHMKSSHPQGLQIPYTNGPLSISTDIPSHQLACISIINTVVTITTFEASTHFPKMKSHNNSGCQDSFDIKIGNPIARKYTMYGYIIRPLQVYNTRHVPSKYGHHVIYEGIVSATNGAYSQSEFFTLK